MSETHPDLWGAYSRALSAVKEASQELERAVRGQGPPQTFEEWKRRRSLEDGLSALVDEWRHTAVVLHEAFKSDAP